MRIGEIRLQDQRLAKAGGGFFRPPLLQQKNAQIVMRLGQAGLEKQRPAVTGFGVACFPLALRARPRAR